MNELKEFLNNENIKINKVTKKGNVLFVDACGCTYCLKKNKRKDINDVNRYLSTKDFNNYVYTKKINKYEIYPYIEEVSYSEEDKAEEIIYLMSLLHNKTTVYQNISIDEIKEMYENHVNMLLSLREYYDGIVYKNIDNTYLSPSLFLFIKNMSYYYSAIDKSKELIDKWYDIMKTKNNKRVVYNHNNLEMHHLIVGDKSYLINWNESKFDVPMNDLLVFFKKNFKSINISSLLKYYNSKYYLNTSELLFLFANLLIPSQIKDDDLEIENLKNVYEQIWYLKNVMVALSEYNLEKYKDK